MIFLIRQRHHEMARRRIGFSAAWSYRLMRFNTSILVNPQLSLLALYNTNPAAYKCPADTSLIQGHPRARSVSMNCAVGTRWYSAGLGPGGTNPGLRRAPRSEEDGCQVTYADPDPIYRTYGKITQMTKPGPSMTWVIMDENPLTINDACLDICMTQILIDFPANYHNGAAGMSFADGHTEMHRWVDAFAQNPSATVTGGSGDCGSVPVPHSQDLAWIQPRTSAPK